MLEELNNVGEKAEKIKKMIYKPEDMFPQEELDEMGN